MSELAPYRSGRILGATWPAGETPAVLAALRHELRGWTAHSGDGWLLATDQPEYLAERDGVIAATTVPRLFDRRNAVLRDPAELAPRLRDRTADTLHSLAAPFRLVWADRARGEIHAATDNSGLGHLFWTSGGGMAVCASSAQLLAALFDAPPAIEGIAAFALFGTFPFAATPYAGITRLQAGSSLKSAEGAIEVHERNGATDTGEDLQTAFTTAVEAMHAAAPQAILELSGGLDSRLILAALPKDQRASHTAITIHDGDNSVDLRIARQLAAMNGLAHREVQLPSDALRDGERLPLLLDHVITGFDAMANPIDGLALVLTLEESNPTRMGGQNGEIIRGFYYPMQPLSEPTSRKLAARLVDWRLIANDRVTPQLFSQNGANALAAARDRQIDILARFDGPWGRRLDQIYLRYRMQSWLGCVASCRFTNRTALWPFFDEAFLAAAMSLDPRRKRDSLAAYDLLAKLDPTLAAMPLDSGLIPTIMAAEGIRAKAAKTLLTGKKAARKIMQRIRPRATGVLGSNRIIDCWHDSEGYKRLDLHRLASLDLFDAAMLDAIGSGHAKPDRATLGFLLLCEAWTQPSP